MTWAQGRGAEWAQAQGQGQGQWLEGQRSFYWSRLGRAMLAQGGGLPCLPSGTKYKLRSLSSGPGMPRSTQHQKYCSRNDGTVLQHNTLCMVYPATSYRANQGTIYKLRSLSLGPGMPRSTQHQYYCLPNISTTAQPTLRKK